MPLRVLLADDHELVRQGLRALLERHGFAIVGEAAEGRTAVTLASELQPDIAVLDVAMPMLNGVGAAEAIARAAPKTRVILLTALNDGQFASSALRAGVRGFVLKLQNIDDLVHAIEEVNEGGLYIHDTAGLVRYAIRHGLVVP